LVFLLVAIQVVVAGCTAGSDTPHHRQSPGLQAAPDDLQRALRDLAPAAAVAVVRTDEGVERAAVGDAESGRAAVSGARFPIASTTKSFVATVALQLVGERRLSLNDTVEARLPGQVAAGDRITLRELMNHSSGLTDPFEPDRPPAFRPGSRLVYANANYVLLGRIVEAVTGRPRDQVVLARVIRPLELENTSYGRSTLSSSTAEGLAWLGFPEALDAEVEGSGGIVSTAEDLASFYAALMSGRLLSRDLLARMLRTVPGPAGFRAGLGIFEVALSCGTAWGHGGDDLAYSVMPLASRDGSTVVVVAQNQTGWTRAKEVAERLFCS
jgi:D-alanyl-D-alanine carboxypeptidase